MPGTPLHLRCNSLGVLSLVHWCIDHTEIILRLPWFSSRLITTFIICLGISRETPFYSSAIENKVLEWWRGYSEVSFKGRMSFKKSMKMWKFQPFLETLVFFQLASFRRSVLLTKQFLQ